MLPIRKIRNGLSTLQKMNCATRTGNYMIIMRWYEKWEVSVLPQISDIVREIESVLRYVIDLNFIISPIITDLMRKFLKPCWLSWKCEAFYWNNCLSSNTLSQSKKKKRKNNKQSRSKSNRLHCCRIFNFHLNENLLFRLTECETQKKFGAAKKIMRKRKECKMNSFVICIDNNHEWEIAE